MNQLSINIYCFKHRNTIFSRHRFWGRKTIFLIFIPKENIFPLNFRYLFSRKQENDKSFYLRKKIFSRDIGQAIELVIL